MPFDDNSFDAISCRMGFMFFPDMLMGVKEMMRVLKPGGRISASVWDTPEKNFWITNITIVIHRYMEFDMPPPGGPGIFRCSDPGLMAGLFAQAGLKNIVQKEVSSTLNCYTTETYWNYMSTSSTFIFGALSQADDKTREKIKNDVYAVVHQRYPEGKVFVESAALVISGEK
jgi:ubiquinone/menaquinone biosynthesis C-methylase UbiE